MFLPNPCHARWLSEHFCLAQNVGFAVQGDVTNIAEALGVPDRGRRVADQMAAVVEDVRRHCLAVRGAAPPPRIALIEWIEPIMGCGHWWASGWLPL